MLRKTLYLISPVLVLGLVQASAANGLDPNLVGWWKFDGPSGTTVTDSSSNNNHGTIYGGASLDGSGQLTLDGNNDYVSLPIGSVIASLTNSTFVVWVDFSGEGSSWQRIFDFGSSTTVNMFLTPRVWFGPMRFAITIGGAGAEQQVTAPDTLPSGLHCVAVRIDADNDTITLFLDGSPIAENTSATLTPSDLGNTANNWLGRSQYRADAYFRGSYQEFRIYDYALSDAQIESLLYIPISVATNPNPPDGANGVEPDADLSWTAGPDAEYHDVYFGTDYSDVFYADSSSGPCDMCVYRARTIGDVNSYTVPEALEYDREYFWRIDEVDPAGVVHPSEVWSFKVLGYKANNPNPPDFVEDVNPFTFLSWNVGIDANSHNVYFGTALEPVENAQRPTGDFNGDGRVDNEDLLMFTEKWLLSVEGQDLKFDFDGDNEVSFEDFAFVAPDWLMEAGDVYKGNFALEDSFYAPGMLRMNQQYYWRVDEVNFADPARVRKGDVWSFKAGVSGELNLLNDFFDITVDSSNGALMSLRNPSDANGSNFLLSKSSYPEYDVDDSYWLGDLIIHYRLDGGGWQRATTGLSDDVRTFSIDDPVGPGQVVVSYYEDAAGAEGIKNFDLTESWSLADDELVWQIKLRNRSGQTMELGDLGIYLPFRTIYDGDTTEIQKNRFIRHDFVAGHGSFVFVNRVSGTGPMLVVTPTGDTKLEYYDQIGFMYDSIPIMYIHSGYTGPATVGTWRQANTTKTLVDGEQITYSFRFQWAEDFDGVRDVLYENDQFDVKVVPGMTVPVDLKAKVALRTKNIIDSVEAEFPSDTTITYLDEPVSDTYVYEIEFSELGENLITVNYDGDKYMTLEFFVTEELETLIKKRSAHLINYQQVRNPNKWYDGLVGPWDMRNSIVRTPDNTDGFDGWWGYVIACDDPGLCHVPLVASKNVHFPNQAEIEGIEYYIENFVWGGLQRMDTESPNPWGIYGVPNWYQHRVVNPDPYHTWRIYDYPHIFMMYYHMYEIAKLYPDMVSYLDKDGYLDRAYHTAMKYFDISSWSYETGTMDELVILNIIDALREEGWNAEADALESHWERKVKYFIYDHPYPYVSEYAYDTTAYESSYAIAKWAMENPLEPDPEHPKISQEDVVEFMARQLLANISARGWLEVSYYKLGSDYRGASYWLSYMAQMGGWAVLDYGLNFASDPIPYLQLGYASYLSSWALMNTGTAESGYGFWYPGIANDGASGWGFQTRKTGPTWLQSRIVDRGPWYYDGEIDLGFSGAIRAACSVVTQDEVFGPLGFGCEVTLSGNDYLIVPKDGLRERLYMTNLGLSIELGRDAFLKDVYLTISQTKDYISFRLENERGTAHTTELTVAGLAVGTYSAKVNGLEQFTFEVTAGDSQTIELNIGAGSDSTVTLERL